jgi:hypothetical protein
MIFSPEPICRTKSPLILIYDVYYNWTEEGAIQGEMWRKQMRAISLCKIHLKPPADKADMSYKYMFHNN